MISDPTNAIAAHLGNGVVQLYVEHADYTLVKRFEVSSALALGGPYQFFSNRYFSGPDGFIYGFVPGFTAYLKVRAIGVDKSIGNWVQVKGGKISRPTFVMECSGIQGSIILPESLFTNAKASRIFGVKNISQINF